MSRAVPILALLALLGCEPPPEQAFVRPVRTVVVGDAAGFQSSTFPGRAKAAQEVDLAFEVPGQLSERPVKTGDVVRRGQLLARIDPRDYEARLHAARGAYQTAKVDYDRAVALVEQEALAAIVRDQRRAQMDVTYGQLKLAEKAVEDTRMYAPFDGTVSLTYVDNFQNVFAKQPVIRLLDLSQIEMVIDVPEGQVGLGQYVASVTVVFDAFPDHPLEARIKEIGGEASATTRTYPVTLTMDPPESFEIKPGMAGRSTGHLELPEDLASRGIEIPVSAIFSPDDESSQQSYVWVVGGEPPIVERRAVEVVRTSVRGVEVQGLEGGERIATAGVRTLREGQEVRLTPDQETGG